MFSRVPARLLEETRPFPGGHAHPPYRLKRSSRRRSLALRVSEAGEIVVNAPLRLAQRRIDEFLTHHGEWIAERLSQARARAFSWQQGVQLPWLGGSLTLAWTPGRTRREGETLYCRQPGDPAGEVLRWYQRQARPLLTEYLARHARIAGLALPPPLRLSNARTRWGSLSAKGVVSLNWRLVKAAPELIDYVVCHELAHFRQRNHSPAFWREVEVLFPDWRAARTRLRQDGRTLFQF
jgi:predicted metal-dependent hydrolase